MRANLPTELLPGTLPLGAAWIAVWVVLYWHPLKQAGTVFADADAAAPPAANSATTPAETSTAKTRHSNR